MLPPKRVTLSENLQLTDDFVMKFDTAVINLTYVIMGK